MLSFAVFEVLVIFDAFGCCVTVLSMDVHLFWSASLIANHSMAILALLA